MRLPLLLLSLFLGFIHAALNATEQAFPPTAAGVSELKTLPAGLLLRTQSGDADYFSSSNRLFRPLFRYISRHDIAMTTPVEATMSPAAMYFWVSPAQREKVVNDQSGVEILELPPRPVASRGARGAYSRVNYETVRDELLAWVDEQPELTPAGPPYAVFWNGPFTPWFAKRFEVHLPLVGPEPEAVD